MTTLRETAEQALAVLEWGRRTGLTATAQGLAISALRGALAEPTVTSDCPDSHQPQITHSEECWRWHHACAVAEIERLRGDQKCRHPEECDRDADGYCAKCHEEMR